MTVAHKTARASLHPLPTPVPAALKSPAGVALRHGPLPVKTSSSSCDSTMTSSCPNQLRPPPGPSQCLSLKLQAQAAHSSQSKHLSPRIMASPHTINPHTQLPNSLTPADNLHTCG